MLIEVQCTLCPKSPSARGSSHLCLFTCWFNTYNTIHFTRFRHCRNAAFKLSWRCDMDLNNTRTSKHATKLCTLGLFGHRYVVKLKLNGWFGITRSGVHVYALRIARRQAIISCRRRGVHIKGTHIIYNFKSQKNDLCFKGHTIWSYRVGISSFSSLPSRTMFRLRLLWIVISKIRRKSDLISGA